MARKRSRGSKDPWAHAKTKYRLNSRQIAMAKELGMNPKKFGKLVPSRSEPWKKPLGHFIEDCHRKRFKGREPSGFETGRSSMGEKSKMGSSNRTEKADPKVGRNETCPCGSGKKYKYCCHLKNEYPPVPVVMKDATFTMDDGTKMTRSVRDIDSIPFHDRDGLRLGISKEEMIDLCVERVHTILLEEKVGMVVDLVERVLRELNIVPRFTYRKVAEQILKDGRFELYAMRICSLKGTAPVELLSERMNHT